MSQEFVIVEYSGMENENVVSVPIAYEEAKRLLKKWYSEEEQEEMSVRIAACDENCNLHYEF